MEAIDVLEKAKLDPSKFPEAVGSGKHGRVWRLIFTSGTKKSQDKKVPGGYFPLVAAQRWVKDESIIQNGVYLGHIAALVFEGNYDWQGKKLNFDFNKLRLKIGPAKKAFKLKPGQFGTKAEADKKAGPFFLFAYADEDIIVARGRGGGVAFWGRLTAADELRLGIETA
eukprot:jgi/Astpho2/491/Aster-03532